MRLLIALLLAGLGCCAQQTVPVKITDTHQRPLSATIIIKETTGGFTTDTAGRTVIPFPTNGFFTVLVSSAGFTTAETRVTIPFTGDTLTIVLEAAAEELDEVIVQSTRTGRTISNVPTRIETIDFEEIDEKNNMRPANVAMLLHESTGIQVQQTSATSANASIRIQGLDGRYTQLLKDGFANFGNFSSGLSVLEIPPLDLKQGEIIKGPASTLFGGGAIAGVINFISKTPKEKPEYSFILNQSGIGQSNAGGFAAARKGKTGYTMLALYSRQNPYDVDDDEFTEVPKTSEFTIHPKLFFYPDRNTTIQLGNSFTKGERTGGDIAVIKGNADATHRYFEKNKTLRNISTLQLDKSISAAKRIMVKQSFGIFDRSISIPDYYFRGKDYSAYTDLSYITHHEGSALVLGTNLIYSNFKETGNITLKRNNRTTTGGAYGQYTAGITDKLKLESGLRLDVAGYSNPLFHRTEAFVLPRISALIKYNAKWASRIGGGMGYKTPTLFTEATERIQYQGVAQLNDVKAEKSYGGTADVNFRSSTGEAFTFSFNHMFFYTLIHRPLVLQENGSNSYAFVNAAQPVTSKGFETNARLVYRNHLKLLLGYTFTESKARHNDNQRFLPLLPRHKLNTALIYEKEDVIKLGLEGYFTGRQYLSDGLPTPAFSEFGFMAEKLFERFSLFINFENFTDTRQSRYKPVVNGSHTAPVFDEIWTHTEGFVINGGVKLRF